LFEVITHIRVDQKNLKLKLKNKKKIYNKIDEKIFELFKEYENGQLTSIELAIKSDKAVKIKFVKNKVFDVNCVFFRQKCSQFLSCLVV
jgi:hypothetical protein